MRARKTAGKPFPAKRNGCLVHHVPKNGRILPNSILRPAIELVTGIKLGPARLPLAPATEEEMAVTTAVLKEIGKL